MEFHAAVPEGIQTCTIWAVWDGIESILIDDFDRKLSKWLDALPTECRRVVELALSGKKNQEIADIMQLALSTVKNQKVKGFKILRELYQHDYILLIVIGFVLNRW